VDGLTGLLGVLDARVAWLLGVAGFCCLLIAIGLLGHLVWLAGER